MMDFHRLERILLRIAGILIAIGVGIHVGKLLRLLLRSL
jgi:hypothetical protein